jgi:hypothetical protein
MGQDRSSPTKSKPVKPDVTKVAIVAEVSRHFFGAAKGQLWDKMAQILFVRPQIKVNQGKSSPRADDFFGAVGGKSTRSLPLVRPSRACGFAQWSSRSCQVFPIIETVAFATSKPFAASQAAQVH